MITEVIKGTDDEIEFKGFKGRYFYKILYIELGLIASTIVLYIMGLNSFWLILFMACIGIFSIFIIQTEMQKNGKYGHIHKSYVKSKSIIQNKPFYKIIK